jgi:predicted ATPase
MNVTNISLRNAWSFGDAGFSLTNLATQNVLIGKNNSGKSKVLAAVAWAALQAQRVANGSSPQMDHSVLHDDGSGVTPEPTILAVALELNGPDRDELIGNVRLARPNDKLLRHVPTRVTQRVHVTGTSQRGGEPQFTLEMEGAESIDGLAGKNEWISGMAQIIRRFASQLISDRIRYVSGWRTLDENTGNGDKRPDRASSIIKHLHEWQNPGQANKHLRRRFDAIEALFRRLMRCDEVEVCPEHTGNAISLAMRGQYIGIDCCGDGLQHLLMIAYHLFTMPDGVLLLEEPETHLHPELQRNLMRVLKREFRGQTIITTHSPVLLDSDLQANIYRVEHDGKTSRVELCKTTSDLRLVLDLLDVRASDLLQANLVIWVEGPTDRMFLNRCLELLGTQFIEGIHYQIVYYGGRLRSHLAFAPDTKDFIDLLRISRNPVMVCDSDKTAETDHIDASKTRLVNECENAGGFAWVTGGREIENYIPDEVLSAAYAELLGDGAKTITLPRFEKLSDVVAVQFPNPIHGDGWKCNYEDNKARIMPVLLRHMTKSSITRNGLGDKLEALVTRIARANGGAC